MSAFGLTCSCGDQLKVDAPNRAEAVKQLQAQMDEKAIAAHMREKHPGQAVPSVAEMREMIATKTAQLH